MKRIVLKTIPALICGIWLASSCTKEENEESALNIKAVVISSPSVRSALTEENVKVDTLLWCYGKNIKWYNETTGELKFKMLEDVHPQIITLSGFFVYLGEEMLFGLGGSVSVSSKALNHPVLVDGIANGENNDTKYYIGRGYPNWEYWTEKFWTDTNWDKATNSWWVEEREQNWKAIEPGLTKFIEQLKKEGKYRK